ncbi:MAG: NYN domain-containing protein [Candidatus Magasanikbacteria bacterium]
MIRVQPNNYAFIDAQNLYLAIDGLGWKLDYKRFRVYLKEKYGVEKAYMFMGFLPENQVLYNFLQSVGYILIFKPIVFNDNGYVKGNCDAELVLQVMIDFDEYNQAIIVSGDGDFYCLVHYLNQHNKLAKVLAPSSENCSSLLTKAVRNKLSLVSDLKKKLEYKKQPKIKGPHTDGTV